MGAVLAKFRKQKTTEEVLEKLEEKIQQIEKYSQNTQERKKRFVGNFLAISIGIYVIAFIVFYFVYFPPTWRERIVYSVPLLLFPLVIILLRKLLTWYFQRKLNKNTKSLTELRGEKKKILEQVMDKETYKVAVNLLARYGDKTNGNKFGYAMTPRVPSGTHTASPTAVALNQTARQVLPTSSNSQPNLSGTLRALNSSLTATPRGVPTPVQRGSGDTRLAYAGMPRQLGLSRQARAGQELRRRTPFPIVNQQAKGVFERMVDVLIGDGPQDRFAMICKECYAHNGMAPKEDFDYTTFRCAFCNALNPSRKARPIAPRLPVQQGSPRAAIAARDSSDSSSSSGRDTDEEHEPIHQVTPLQLTELNADAAPASELHAAEPAASETNHSEQAEIVAASPSLPEPAAAEPEAESAEQAEVEAETESHAAAAAELTNANDEFKKEM